MALSITKELESTLGLAFAEAKARRHEHVTLEHLLYALLRDPVAVRVLRACGARMAELKRELEQHLLTSQPQLPEGSERDPEQTRAFQRVLERAAMQVQPSGSAPSRCSAEGGRTTPSTWARPAWARRPWPRAWRSPSTKEKFRKSSAMSLSMRSTWARCSPAPSSAASSRSGSRRW